MHAEKITSVTIETHAQKMVVKSPSYGWEWDAETDIFSLYDAQHRLISRGRQQPLIITPRHRAGLIAPKRTASLEKNRAVILYSAINDGSTLAVTWVFHNDFITLEPLRYETLEPEEIVRVAYFAGVPENPLEQAYSPTLYSRYVVVPGLCMSTNISPVVDLHSRLNVSAVLGSGAMRGPGLTQQWGLPAHYFCAFNTSERWNAIGAKDRQSGAVCWGLRELPQGDYRLEIREGAVSPVLNIRSDIWKQLKTPGALELGFSFVLTFGEHYHAAIRKYYKALVRGKIIQTKKASAKKNEVCSPRNTIPGASNRPWR